jgi:hypothetical protein
MSAEAATAAAPKLSPRRNSVAHAWLTSPVYQRLLIEAERRGEHPDHLAAAIINGVLLNGYTCAVLDC